METLEIQNGCKKEKTLLRKVILGMTQSFYHRLMSAGVRIFEYEPGFVHAKSYLADDEIAMIGTINLDYRSLVHHFENGVWTAHKSL